MPFEEFFIRPYASSNEAGVIAWLWHQGYRRKEFARELMVASKARLHAFGFAKINLQVRATNP
jgi:hypothetical protein